MSKTWQLLALHEQRGIVHHVFLGHCTSAQLCFSGHGGTSCMQAWGREHVACKHKVRLEQRHWRLCWRCQPKSHT